MLGRLFDKLARAPGGSANSRPLIWSAIERMLREENCKSRILLDTVESSEYTVGHGLREGSVLSPILYAVFVDGIVDRLDRAHGPDRDAPRAVKVRAPARSSIRVFRRYPRPSLAR